MFYYTSDLHLRHENVIKFDNRPFRNAAEMEQAIIKNWNARVKPEDTVYILGDLCMSKDPHCVNAVLSQLKGKKYIIKGNHDYAVKKIDRSLVLGIADTLEILDPLIINGKQQFKEGKPINRHVVLSHYPMAVWNKSHYGSIHLYGHVHNQEEALIRHPVLQHLENAYNVGCMNFSYTPVTLDEIIAHYGHR